jgi:hypothetical protein
MLYLQHDFYNIIFKIKHKLYIALGLAPPPLKEKLWVRTCHSPISCVFNICFKIILPSAPRCSKRRGGGGEFAYIDRIHR